MYIHKQFKKDIKIQDLKDFELTGNQTILENINRLIKYIQTNKVLASKARGHFPIKQIQELNSILVKPYDIISTRPQQQTYPNLNGLYLILRSMGILTFAVSKKEIVMGIDEKLLKNWQKLNETEQYFTLLEIWLVRAKQQTIINSGGYQDLAIGSLYLFFRKNHSITQKEFISNLHYIPEYHNLALLEMFGFIDIKDSKPKEKNRWNIIDVKITPLIQMIYPLIILDDKELSQLIFDIPKQGFYKEIFQPYFKDLNNSLKYPADEVRNGTFVLKITLQKAYRSIEVPSDIDFENLAELILQLFNFDNDHLFEFVFTNRFGEKKEVKSYHSIQEESDFDAGEFYLKNLPLKELENFTFIFDFGAWWEFDILIEKFYDGKKIEKVEIIKSHGEAPEQYDFSTF